MKPCKQFTGLFCVKKPVLYLAGKNITITFALLNFRKTIPALQGFKV